MRARVGEWERAIFQARKTAYCALPKHPLIIFSSQQCPQKSQLANEEVMFQRSKKFFEFYENLRNILDWFGAKWVTLTQRGMVRAIARDPSAKGTWISQYLRGSRTSNNHSMDHHEFAEFVHLYECMYESLLEKSTWALNARIRGEVLNLRIPKCMHPQIVKRLTNY